VAFYALQYAAQAMPYATSFTSAAIAKEIGNRADDRFPSPDVDRVEKCAIEGKGPRDRHTKGVAWTLHHRNTPIRSHQMGIFDLAGFP
jgi:hypothetical protein